MGDSGDDAGPDHTYTSEVGTPAAASISMIGAEVGIASPALIYRGVGGGAMAQTSGRRLFVAGVCGIVLAAGAILPGPGILQPERRDLTGPGPPLSTARQIVRSWPFRFKGASFVMETNGWTGKEAGGET